MTSRMATVSFVDDTFLVENIESEEGERVTTNEERQMGRNTSLSTELTMGSSDPLDIFPEEVWTIILENLKGRDAINCQQACSLFRKILRPTRCTWLFCEVFSHVIPYLTNEEILDCRETGREWQKAVDGYFESHVYYTPFDEATYDYRHFRSYPAKPRLNRRGFGTTGFCTTQKLKSFQEKMGNPDVNPFIGRSLWIQYDSDDDSPRLGANELDGGGPQKFWLAVFEFLELYGKHIWYFSMGRFCQSNNLSRLIYVLRGCLSRLPNLKRLCIMGGVSECLSTRFQEDETDHVEESELVDYLKSRPFPVVASLENLKINCMVEDPNLIYEHLIGLHRSQLKSLSSSRFGYLNLDKTFPSLKELELTLGSIDAMDRIEEVIWRLHSPLGKLNLSIQFDETQLDFQRLFRLISVSFGSTLQVLQMSVSSTRHYWVSSRAPREAEPVLRCPHLRTLDLTGFNFNTFSIDFLLGVASSLQFLLLRVMSYDSNQSDRLYDGKEILDLYHYIHRVSVAPFYLSNVWYKIGKLKMVSVEAKCSSNEEFVRRVYRREMLEYLKRNGTLDNR